MADDGSEQGKSTFRTAVEDVKALAKVLDLRSPAVLAAIGVAATLVLALVVVMALSQTGDANAVSDNAAVIGALVALGGVFTAQMVSVALEDRRSLAARDLEAQRANETALQNYFEEVGALLIEKPLRRASPGDNLSTVVRAQTLSVFAGLDPDRKRILLQFLYDSGLIHKAKPVVSLNAANLFRANLSNANLIDADLNGADLSNANLSNADLFDANLSTAVLIHTNLSDARLNSADLSDAYLNSADLSDAYLIDVDLNGADLIGAKLRNADLSYADLFRVTLQGATLQGATGVTSQELEQQAYSLKGATMPDGSKHP